jgi:hypothetical protein
MARPRSVAQAIRRAAAFAFHEGGELALSPLIFVILLLVAAICLVRRCRIRRRRRPVSFLEVICGKS